MGGISNEVINMRKEYELSDDQLKGLMSACEPVPMIMLQCGTPTSPQERANSAWLALGKDLGFQHMTVEPVSGKGAKFFTADSVELLVRQRSGQKF